MVAVFIYSKRYGDQGPPISNPTSTHHFSMSVPLSGGTYSTRRGAVKLLADMQIKYIKANGFNFQSGNGLIGNGLVNNPLKVDTNWIDANFINSKYWQFSQVGDPTDQELPISGSYFSVSYPYGNEVYRPTAFVEGNGDMRILRHVTNGEDQRVVYSVWKNYRQTTIDKIRHTDNVYTIPGLFPDEYIHNVFQMSSQAMIAEVWTESFGFKEYIFINLNGTSIGRHHTFIRLGDGPLGIFNRLSGFTLQQRRSIFRATNIMAAIVSGRRFILAQGTAGSGMGCFLQIAEVAPNGTLTLLTGLNSRNTLGFTTTNQDRFVLFNKAASNVAEDLDRCYLVSPEIGISHHNAMFGSSPFTAMSVQETKDGKIALYTNHYAAISYSTVYQNAFKAQFFYIIDPIAKTMVPESTTGVNRNYQATITPPAQTPTFTYPLTYGMFSHYWAWGQTFVALPTGDRLEFVSTENNLDILPLMYLRKGKVDTIAAAISDVNFNGGNIDGVAELTMNPPTPVYANKTGILLYDNLVVVNSNYTGNISIHQGSYSKLVGSKTSKTYKLLDPNGAQTLNYTGYPLVVERGNLNSFSLAMSTFRSVSGEIYYHNAMWGSGTPDNSRFDSMINSNLQARGQYSCDRSVYDKMEEKLRTYWNTSTIPNRFTEVHQSRWLIIPAHSSISRNHVFYKVVVSFSKPDATDPTGKVYSGAYIAMGMMDATIAVNGDGDCRLSDINVNMLRLEKAKVFSSTFNFSTSEPRTWGCSVFLYRPDGVSSVITGGWTASTNSAANLDAWLPHGFKTDFANANPTLHLTPYVNRRKVAVHKTLGLGYISNEFGMGTMYCFHPASEVTLMEDSTLGGPYVLGSARPSAGFSLTVTSPVEIYNQGKLYTIPVQTVDITKINPSSETAHINAHLYMYAILINGIANFKISYTTLPEHNAQIFLGHIYTSDTEITSIVADPISRWEMARPSTGPVGSVLPVATGVPSSLGTDSIWAGRAPGDTYTGEYLWGDEDLYDTDIIYETTIVASYWASDAAGSQGITRLSYGEPGYFIVKTQGPATELLVKISIPTANQEMFEHGVLEAWANIPINVDANGNGIGSYLIKSWSEDDMLFNNYDYFDVTAQRQAYTKYVNDTGKVIFIAISVRTNDGFNAGQLLINDKQVAYVDGHQSNGTGNWWPNLGFIIPAGMSYQFNGNPAMLTQWVELRPK